MYVRPRGYSSPHGIELPRNYSGNAFREVIEDEEIAPLSSDLASPEPKETESSENTPDVKETLLPLSPPHTPPTSSKNTGLGSEELLLLALVFLLSEGESSDELVWLLLLLFFIK